MFEFIGCLLLIVLFFLGMVIVDCHGNIGKVWEVLSDTVEMVKDFNGPFSQDDSVIATSHMDAVAVTAILMMFGVMGSLFSYLFAWGACSMMGVVMLVLTLTVAIVMAMSFLFHAVMAAKEAVEAIVFMVTSK